MYEMRIDWYLSWPPRYWLDNIFNGQKPKDHRSSNIIVHECPPSPCSFQWEASKVGVFLASTSKKRTPSQIRAKISPRRTSFYVCLSLLDSYVLVESFHDNRGYIKNTISVSL